MASTLLCPGRHFEILLRITPLVIGVAYLCQRYRDVDKHTLADDNNTRPLTTLDVRIRLRFGVDVDDRSSIVNVFQTNV